MVAPAAGGIVLVPFPFPDLTQAKLVTSNPYGDPRAVHLTPSSFDAGSLRSNSYARPGKLFTASRELMVDQVAVLNGKARQRLIGAVVSILKPGESS